MKWSFATVGIILLGLTGVAIILLFQQITTNNENDYYLLKEITEAAMIDAVDYERYRETGNLKIVKEKFVENFTRRFAESTIFVTNDYNINFYDIIEEPPKVSIIIDTGLGTYTVGGNADEYGIANKLDAILEFTGEKTYLSSSVNPYEKYCISCIGNAPLKETYYLLMSEGDNKTLSLKTPSELMVSNIKNINIESISNVRVVTGQGELNQALMRSELTYNNVPNKYKLSSGIHYSSDYDGSISSTSIGYHNCSEGRAGYDCNDTNKYFITVNGTVSGKVILKYDVTWSYDEYEFSN